MQVLKNQLNREIISSQDKKAKGSRSQDPGAGCCCERTTLCRPPTSTTSTRAPGHTEWEQQPPLPSAASCLPRLPLHLHPCLSPPTPHPPPFLSSLSRLPFCPSPPKGRHIFPSGRPAHPVGFSGCIAQNWALGSLDPSPPHAIVLHCGNGFCWQGGRAAAAAGRATSAPTTLPSWRNPRGQLWSRGPCALCEQCQRRVPSHFSWPSDVCWQRGASSEKVFK